MVEFFCVKGFVKHIQHILAVYVHIMKKLNCVNPLLKLLDNLDKFSEINNKKYNKKKNVIGNFTSFYFLYMI